MHFDGKGLVTHGVEEVMKAFAGQEPARRHNKRLFSPCPESGCVYTVRYDFDRVLISRKNAMNKSGEIL